MDLDWLGNHIKHLSLELAAVRGEARRQIEEKDREIAALREKLGGGQKMEKPGPFINEPPHSDIAFGKK